MNRILQQYLDDLRRELRTLPYDEQDAVLRDVQSHLESATATARSGGGLSEDEAMLQATHDFGAPSEIGIQYGPQGGVVDKTTGEVILRVAVLTGRGLGKAAKATGRGIGKALKWSFITAAILLAVAIVVGLVIAVTYKDTISDNIDNATATRQVYSKVDFASQPKSTLPATESFAVTADARSLDFQLEFRPTGGCLKVQLTAPDGKAVYDNGDGCSAAYVRQSFTGSGTWKIAYTYVAFTGTLDIEATQIGF